MGDLVVIGMGHIGGSVAAGAKARGLFARAVGVDSDPEARTQARDRRLADLVVEDVAGACARADVVVVAVPPAAVPAAVAAALVAAPKAVVTDVAGVKAPVVARVRELAGAAAARRFVGGHPMAGTAGKGPAAADPELFDGRRVVVTPVAETEPAAVSVVEGLWRGLGATPVRVDPEVHDRAIAVVSHLPHLLAFGLEATAASMLAPGGETGGEDLARGAQRVTELAGPSFESATRVAVSAPELWTELFTENAAADRAALETLRGTLDELARLLDRLAAGDATARTELRERLRHAQALATGRRA